MGKELTVAVAARFLSAPFVVLQTIFPLTVPDVAELLTRTLMVVVDTVPEVCEMVTEEL